MKKLILLVLALALAVLFYFFDAEISATLINTFSLGWVIANILVRMVIVCCLTIALGVTLRFIVKRINKILNLIVSFVVAFGISFALNPIYIDDYGLVEQTKELGFDLVYSHFSDLEQYEKPYVVAFFTSTCPYCEMAAENFMTNSRNHKQPRTIILFPSTPYDAEQFMARTKANFGYGLITDEQFLDNAGNRFPSVFLVQNGQVLNHWVGSEINLSALDLLREKSED